MLKFRATALGALASALALTALPAAAATSVLVASGDEWTLSDYAYEAPYVTGTQAFAQALATTFGGTNYLLLSGNMNIPASQLDSLAAQFTGLGKSVTLSNTFSLAAAQGYDAVFHFGQPVSPAEIAAYVTGGGNAYVSLGAGYYGTAAAEAAAWNPTLAQFGLVAGPTWFTAQAFVEATVTTGPPGATVVAWGYGQSIDKLTPGANSVSYLRGSFAGGPTDIGLVGASQALGVTGGVPEPASWALMIAGFGMAGAVLRRRATHALAA